MGYYTIKTRRRPQTYIKYKENMEKMGYDVIQNIDDDGYVIIKDHNGYKYKCLYMSLYRDKHPNRFDIKIHLQLKI